MAQPELTWNPDQIGAYKVIINLASEKRSYSADINDVIKVIPNRHIPNSVLNQNMIKDFEKYRQYVPFFNSPYLDEMMLWIKDNYDKVCDTSGTRLKADFVCYRGSLTTIMLAEFENQGFCIEARKLGGTIFFILNKVCSSSFLNFSTRQIDCEKN